jgi:tRNA (uracil-5-)-methyltransferase
MDCLYIGVCGGCTLGNFNYNEQLNFKILREKNRFRDIYNVSFDIIKSDKNAFRNRAEFRIFHKASKISYAMIDIDKKILTIDKCPIVSKTISVIMDKILNKIQQNQIISKRLFSIEFLSSTINDTLVTLIYHKKLDNLWETEAKELENQLKIKIIGRSKKQKIIVSKDFINENIFDFNLKYFDGSFAQPNANVNKKMITWVLDNISKGKDLCELYCGNGNFTLPLSFKFNKVLATEISKTSIKNIKLNCQLNDIKNIKCARLSAQEFTQAINNTRIFRRLVQENINFDDYDFSTILVDPPRAGLDDITLDLVKKFNQVIYISCNSQTLHRDLKYIMKTHKIKKFAFFDQFAYTSHIECGVILVK